MTQQDQQQAFQDALEGVVDRFVGEFDLSLSSAIGVLELVKLDLYLRETAADVEEDLGS